MNLTIHTYGHIDAMFYILNGIKMIMNSGFASMMIQTVAIVATFYYGLKAAYANSSGGAKQHLVKVAGMIIVINALLVPKTSMFIEDHVTKQRDHVDGLPYSFAVPIGFMEKFGDILTEAFEQAFTPVPSDDRVQNNYRDYGMVFGARLIQEARKFKITTPEFAHNMDTFIKRCVVMDVAMGNKYTLNELLQSNDIWELVSKKASPLRRVEMKIGKFTELKTCKEAATEVIAPDFVSELDKIIQKYTKTEYALAGEHGGLFSAKGTARNVNKFFKDNLSTVFKQQLGDDGSAESHLRQYMMLNSMSDHARTYGFARANMTQESNWRISGDLANVYLPMLLSVIKGLVYTSFIFMVPIMLMGGGMGKYLSYISVIASLQLWPALNAVLNMFIELYSATQMQDIGGGGISFTSYSRVGDYSDKIVAVASGLQMTIPFLAFSIVQGGVSGFIHLASSITGASTAAASTAAQEVTTGNKSFDNYSAGNMQVAMQQGFKTDWNSSYKAGASETQLSDGTMAKWLPSGKFISMMGPGITESAGLSKISYDTQDSSQLVKSYNESVAYRKGLELQKSEAVKAQDSMLKQYASTVAKHATANEGLKFEKLGTAAEGVRTAIEHNKNFGESYDYMHGQNSVLQGSFSVDVGGSGSAGVGGRGGGSKSPSLGVNAGITTSFKGDFLSNSMNTQSLSEHANDSRSDVWNEDKNLLLQASSNKEFSKSAGVSEDLLKNISASSEVIDGFDKLINQSLVREQQLAENISHNKSAGVTFSTDITSEVQEELKQSMHPLEANRALSNPNSNRAAVNQATNTVVSRYKTNNSEVANIPDTIAQKKRTLPQDAANEMSAFETKSRKEVEDKQKNNQKHVDQVAKNNNINADEIKVQVTNAENKLQDKVTNQQHGIQNDAKEAKNKRITQMNAKQLKTYAEDDKRFRLFSKDPMFGKPNPRGD